MLRDLARIRRQVHILAVSLTPVGYCNAFGLRRRRWRLGGCPGKPIDFFSSLQPGLGWGLAAGDSPDVALQVSLLLGGGAVRSEGSGSGRGAERVYPW